MNKINENGRSMIEMLGVLAIIGVLSVGGIMGYSKAMFRYKINKTIDQITYIAGNIRTTFASQGNYQGLDTYQNRELFRKAHIVPDDMPMDVSYGSPIHLWDERVSIRAKRKNSADNFNKAFSISYRNLPEDACIELITQDWSNAQVKMISVYGYYVATPVKLDDAVKICRSDYSDIYFYFDIDTSDSLWKDQIDETTAALAGS